MAESINIPPNPTNADLAHAIVQTHACLENLRTDLAPVISFALNTKKVSNRVWKFGVWIGPMIVAALIGAYANLIVSQQALQASAAQSAHQAKVAVIVAARTHATVSQALGSP